MDRDGAFPSSGRQDAAADIAHKLSDVLRLEDFERLDKLEPLTAANI
jgi:hypothetical protein